jgi:site-specific recombinase XerD
LFLFLGHYTASVDETSTVTCTVHVTDPANTAFSSEKKQRASWGDGVPPVDWQVCKRLILENAVAPSSAAHYDGNVMRYIRFCEANSLDYKEESSFCLWVFPRVHAEPGKFSKSTIDGWRSSVSHLFRLEDSSPTEGALAKTAVAAAKRFAREPRSKQELSSEDLHRILSSLHNGAKDSDDLTVRFLAVRDGLLILVAFRALLRGAEASNLLCDEIFLDEVGGQQCLFVAISARKNSTQRSLPRCKRTSGDVLVLCSDRVILLCPVAWYQGYVRLRTALGISSVAFFCSASGETLSPDLLRSRLKVALKRVGIDPSSYGGHSTRSGAATALVKKGVSIRVLKKLGGWKSDAVYVYVRDDAAELCSALALLGSESEVPDPENPGIRASVKSKVDDIRRNGFHKPGGSSL